VWKFLAPQAVEYIDGFQLQGLLNNYIGFDFYVFEDLDRLADSVQRFVKSATGAKSFPGIELIKEQISDLRAPMVLMCKDGKVSAKVSRELTQMVLRMSML